MKTKIRYAYIVLIVLFVGILESFMFRNVGAKASHISEKTPLIGLNAPDEITPETPFLWRQLSLVTSFAYDIAVDPTNPANIYVGTGNATIPFVYSHDYGTTWITQTTGLPVSNVHSVAIDPTNSDVLYVGLYPDNMIDRGVYKSEDGGASWDLKNNGMDPLPGEMTAMLVYPITPTIVLATHSARLYRSEDGGENWTSMIIGVQADGSSVKQLVMDSSNPPKIYAVGRAEGVFVSEDAGETWVPTGFQADSLAIDPQDIQVFYRVQCVVEKSVNGGNTWTPLPTPQACYERVTTDPIQSGVLYLTGQFFQVMQSLDGGNSWRTLNPTPPGIQSPSSWTFEIDPVDSSRLYVF
ncbi:MAG TPA: hypothetical protein PK530_21130, partial [Anaerolineales bacterium]|nr:hypothetical protein [Anaerolineales bacterium]